MTPGSGHLRVIPDLAHLAVRNILGNNMSEPGSGTSTALAYLLPPKYAWLPGSLTSAPSMFTM